MMSQLRLRSCLSLVLELAAWLGPSMAFLYVYLDGLGGSATAVMPHLWVVLTLMTATLLARWVCLVAFGSRTAAAIGSLVTALALSMLWAYYVLVIVGFGAWGYLVSWGLVSAYLSQALYLLQALGPRAYVTAAVVAAVFVLLLAGVHSMLRWGDWLSHFVRRFPAPGSVVMALLLFAAVGISFWRFIEFPPTDKGEPLALTFNPTSFDRKFQSHFRSRSPQGSADEKAARAAYRPAGSLHTTNVILIVVDALRGRNMGAYGYARNTTPFLSSLAREGRLNIVANAHSVCAESACGLMGIASSRYVHQFVERPMTLQEVLRLHGYQIHMLLGGDHTHFYGLRDMYGKVDTYFDGSMNSAFYINDDSGIVDALRKLQPRASHSNFMQFHLMSNHVLGRRPEAIHKFGEARSYYAATSEMALTRPSSSDIPSFINFYDAGVVQADEAIKEILTVLRAKGLLDDAIVVVTADHGELVGEHGLYGHAKSVYAEVLDVPLMLMSTQALRPLRIDATRLASQVDVAPTVLTHLGLPVPATWSGIPLQLGGASKPSERVVYFQQGSEFGLIRNGTDGVLWKYWVNAKTGQEFAFDITADPAESVNRIGALPSALRALWRSGMLPMEVNVRESIAVR